MLYVLFKLSICRFFENSSFHRPLFTFLDYRSCFFSFHILVSIFAFSQLSLCLFVQVYLRRSYSLEGKEPINYNDRLGPAILVCCLICALSAIIILNIVYGPADEYIHSNSTPSPKLQQHQNVVATPTPAAEEFSLFNTAKPPSTSSANLSAPFGGVVPEFLSEIRTAL